MTETSTILATRSLLDVVPLDVQRVTSGKTLPLYASMFHALVGPSETGKSTIAAHVVLDVAGTGRNVLVCDGEMSAPAWRRKLAQLGADDDALAHVHYIEMTAASANVTQMRATVASLDVRLVVWDSALSIVSRTAKSENDNAEVGRVFDRLRAILADGPAGLIVDHSANGAASPVSRGASAKFAALDVSFGVRLTEGSIPGPCDIWSSVVSVEKDRHGLLGSRSDREVTFCPFGNGSITVDIAETQSASHRLSATNPVAVAEARIAELDPPAKSANDAFRRVGGSRAVVLAAFKKWSERGGTDGTPLRESTAVPLVPSGTDPVRNRSTAVSGSRTRADVLPLRRDGEQ